MISLRITYHFTNIGLENMLEYVHVINLKINYICKLSLGPITITKGSIITVCLINRHAQARSTLPNIPSYCTVLRTYDPCFAEHWYCVNPLQEFREKIKLLHEKIQLNTIYEILINKQAISINEKLYFIIYLYVMCVSIVILYYTVLYYNYYYITQSRPSGRQTYPQCVGVVLTFFVHIYSSELIFLSTLILSI